LLIFVHLPQYVTITVSVGGVKDLAVDATMFVLRSENQVPQEQFRR
jgi:hypothetical protein